jgi:hypothetical protein
MHAAVEKGRESAHPASFSRVGVYDIGLKPAHQPVELPHDEQIAHGMEFTPKRIELDRMNTPGGRPILHGSFTRTDLADNEFRVPSHFPEFFGEENDVPGWTTDIQAGDDAKDAKRP